MKTRSLTAFAVFAISTAVLAQQQQQPDGAAGFQGRRRGYYPQAAAGGGAEAQRANPNARPAAPTTQPRKSDAPPIDLSGTWKGVYSADPNINLAEMTLTKGADPQQFTGEVHYSAVPPPGARGRVEQGLEGSWRVTVIVDPGACTAYFAPAGWIKAPQMGLFTGKTPPDAMAAVFSAKRNELAGQFQSKYGPRPDLPYFVFARGDGAAALTKLADHAAATMVPPPAAQLGDGRGGASGPTEEALTKWVSKFTQEYPNGGNQGIGQINAQAMPLLSDATFKPVFGDTYEALDQQVLLKAIQIFRQPARARQYMYAEYILRPAPSKFVGVAAMRTVGAWQAEAVERFRDHPLTATAFADIDATEQAMEQRVTLAWPSDQRHVTDALDQLRPRLSGSALAVSADHAISVAAGLAGAKSLANWSKENASALGSATPEQRAAAQQKVDAKLDELLQPLVKQQVDRLATFGTGITAVRSGGAWYKSLQAQFGFAAGRPPVQDAVAKLSARREADLKAGHDDLVRAISAATTVDAVDQMFASDLAVPVDHTYAVYKDLVAVADKRKQALKDQALLALFSPEERTAMDRPGHIDLKKAKPRPPTAEEIRLALVRGYAAGNDGKVIDPHTCRHTSVKDSVFGLPYPVIISFSDEKLISADPVENEPGVYDCQFQVAMTFKIANDNVLANYDAETRKGSQQMADLVSAFSRLGRETNDVQRQKFRLDEDGWGCPEFRQAGEIDRWFYKRIQSPR